MGGLGAADRTGPAARQDAAQRVAADDLGDLVAAPERREVAQHPDRIGSVVAGGATLLRWAKQGVWERLLDLVQQHDIALGMTFLDGTNIRAHHKAAGAKKRGSTASSEMCARRLAALAAATARKPV